MSSTAQPERQIAATSLKRIVVATDFSPAARLAVVRAGQLARDNGSHLHVVHAHPDWNLFSRSSSVATEHYRAVVEHADRCLADELRFLESRFGIRVRGECRTGRASEVLASVAAELSPHLIVIGARGEHGEPVAPFLGGTALKLLTFSSTPVLIVRKESTGPYTVSLAAIEATPGTARAVINWARAIAPAGDCHLVHVCDIPYATRMRARGVSETELAQCGDAMKAAGTRFMNEVLQNGPDTKLRTHTHLVLGEPVSSILAEIERLEPEVTLVGRHPHPRTELRERAFGSVAMRVAYHAPGDVLLVP